MQRLSSSQKKLLIRIIISAVLFFSLLIAEHTGALSAISDNAFAMIGLYLVPYFLCGYEVVIKCFRRIAKGLMLDETFLMTLATVGAFATAEYSEGVAVMLFYVVGEFFQDYAVGKSRASIQALLSIAPEYANVEREDGNIEVIDPEDVEIGNILLIKPGEKIPVDGTVIEGSGYVNTSALTGESVPREISVGEEIISGCINGDTALRVRADKLYDDSTVAQILELVENAAEKKSNTEAFITRFARYYTPIVVACAVILAFIPPLFVGNFSDWILRACSFLVISCPCALVISVPLSFFGGIGAASNIGVLVKGSNYLEMMAKLDTLVSDKTGTLTEGKFKLVNIESADGFTDDELIYYAAGAEFNSTHPIALAITEACKSQIDASAIKEVVNEAGKGISALVNDHRVVVGNRKQLEAMGISGLEEFDGTTVFVAVDGKYAGRLEVFDAPKNGAKEAVAELAKLGVRRLVMLSGDSEASAKKVAKELGITDYRAGLLPQDKVSCVEELLESTAGSDRKLAFVGDGINDAPVLSRSDIGIAMGSLGSDAAIEAADVVIMDDNIGKIPLLVRIARKTVGIAKVNIVFALTVKAVCLVLGALGIAGMWVAVFADVGVAMICILNSMRMLRFKS